MDLNMKLEPSNGSPGTSASRVDPTLIESINLRLAMTGCPTLGNGHGSRLPEDRVLAGQLVVDLQRPRWPMHVLV